MLGFWRGSGGAEATVRESGTPFGLTMNCTLNWGFSSQTAGAFTGSLSARGQSPSSDWRCAHQGSVSGQLESDGRLSIRFDPPFTPGGCTNIAQSDSMIGQMNGDDAFTVTATGSGNCQFVMGNPDPALRKDVDYTLTLTGRRR